MVFQPVIPVFIILGLVVAGLAGVSFLIWRNKPQRKWWILRAVYVVLVGAMLLRPSVPAYQDVEVYTNQYDIYFVVDTTASMVAEDWVKGGEQTRLDGVKQDIQNLAMSYTSAKFSLMRFDSSSATTTVPLTKDVTTFMTGVRNLTPELTRQSQGSSPFLPADGLASLIARNSEDETERARIVFYFGDGEITSSSPVAETFDKVSPLIAGGKVYGYGTETGGKMKYQNGYYITAETGYIKDNTTGEEGISKIDEVTLNEIASQIGVEYEHRTSETVIKPTDIDDSKLVSSTSPMNSLIDYSWVLGIVLVGLVSVEIGLIALSLRRTAEVKR